MALWEKESEGLITPVPSQLTPKCGSKEKCDTLPGPHLEGGGEIVCGRLGEPVWSIQATRRPMQTWMGLTHFLHVARTLRVQALFPPRDLLLSCLLSLLLEGKRQGLLLPHLFF